MYHQDSRLRLLTLYIIFRGFSGCHGGCDVKLSKTLTGIARKQRQALHESTTCMWNMCNGWQHTSGIKHLLVVRVQQMPVVQAVGLGLPIQLAHCRHNETVTGDEGHKIVHF